MAGKDWTPADIFQTIGHTWTALTLQAAVKLDLFTALDRGPENGLTVAALAAAIGGESRAVDMLATALTSLGFLERDGDRIRPTSASRRYLSADSDEYYGFMVKHGAHILPGWLHLDQAVKTGARVADHSSLDTESDEQREAFLMGMFNVARLQADQVAAALDLSGRRRLLDLGGGPGTYAIHFCRRYPELRATVFDQPTTERFARATIARFGLEDRVDFVGGDFLADGLPKNFDAAWLSQVLHGEDPAGAALLVKRGAEALDRGGLLAVQEFILDDDRRGPAQSALFSLNMLVQTPGGQAYTQREIAAMMADAGLGNITRLAAQLPPGCGLMVGIKD